MRKILCALTSCALWSTASQAALLAEWKFDEGSGTDAADAVGGHDGTVMGASWSTNGVDGGAIDCAGIGKVSIPAEAFESLTDTVTLSMWVLGSEEQPVGDIAFCAENVESLRVLNIHVPWSNGSVYFDAGRSGALYDRVYAAVADEYDYKGKWNHWVFTKDAGVGVMTIYVNGAQFLSGTMKTNGMEGITTAFIGGSSDTTMNYRGMIDEVQLYDEALDAAAVSDLYESYNFIPPDNFAPTADAQGATVNMNEPKGIVLTGSDPDDDDLTYTVTVDPTNGTLSGTAPNLTYTPDLDYTGSDSFTFVVNDGEVDSDPALVSLSVLDPEVAWTAVPAPQATDGSLATGLFETSGTFVYAENTGGPEMVFDGITFQAATTAVTTVIGDVAQLYAGYHPSASEPQLSSSGLYPPTSTVTPTLDGLVVGKRYRIQALFFDERKNQTGQKIYIDDQNVGQYGNGVGGAGLLATRTFTAESASITIKFQRTNRATDVLYDQVQLNALAVFQLGAPTTGYEDWTARYGLVDLEALAAADLDLDGLDNLMEYALGGNPTNDDAVAVAPSTFVMDDGGVEYLYHVHVERATDSTLSYTLGATENLALSAPDAGDVSYVGESGLVDGFKSVTNRTEATSSVKFIRLDVEM